MILYLMTAATACLALCVLLASRHPSTLTPSKEFQRCRLLIVTWFVLLHVVGVNKTEEHASFNNEKWTTLGFLSRGHRAGLCAGVRDFISIRYQDLGNPVQPKHIPHFLPPCHPQQGLNCTILLEQSWFLHALPDFTSLYLAQ